jgi:GTPase SAR1 family protein
MCNLSQDEYSILNSKHAIGIHGYVLVYSVTSRNSFDMIQIVYDKIISYCGMNDIPCVIVGSKTDLQARYVSFFPFSLAHVMYFLYQRQSLVLTVLLPDR